MLKTTLKASILCVAIAFVSCRTTENSSERTRVPAKKNTQSTCLPAGRLALADEVTYVDDVKAILDTSCVNCHAAYKTYAGAKSGGAGILESVTSNDMPPGPKKLGAAEKKLLTDWKAQGYLEKAAPLVSDTPAPTTPGGTGSQGQSSGGGTTPPPSTSSTTPTKTEPKTQGTTSDPCAK